MGTVIETPDVQQPRTLAVWIATAGGIGYAPSAPGTFGSLAGLALFLLLSHLTLGLYAITVVALTSLGVWASDRAEAYFGREDDGRIVIDEVAGQLLTLLPLVALGSLQVAGLESLRHGESTWIALVVTGFVAFRVFDIWKPGPVRWGEQRFEGGLGVMADDVIAGVLAALLLTAPAYAALLFHLQPAASGGGS